MLHQSLTSMKKYVFLILLVGIIVSSCDKNSQIVVFKKNIKYVVSGTANDYWIQYNDEYGNYKQMGSVTTWEYEFKARSGKYLYLSARNNTAYGAVKVEVFQGSKLILTAYNDVPYGDAVVSGNVD